MENNKEQTETADIETSSEEYAKRFAGPTGEWMLGVQTKFLLDFLSSDNKGTVLDVGGGHAQTALPLMKPGWEVTVAGSAAQCVLRLQPHVAMGRIYYRTCNLLKMPFEDKSFDVVVSVRFLPHCSHWQDFIRELCRVSQNKVVVDYPVIMSFNFFYPLMFKLKRKLEKNTRSFSLFTNREVDFEFEKNGFYLLRRKRQFFMPMVAHRVINNPFLSQVSESIFRAVGFSALFGSPVMVCYVRK